MVVSWQSSEREVSKDEGVAFAKTHGCLFVETSAKVNVAVGQAFEELVMQILDTPALLTGTGTALRLNPKMTHEPRSSCC